MKTRLSVLGVGTGALALTILSFERAHAWLGMTPSPVFVIAAAVLVTGWIVVMLVKGICWHDVTAGIVLGGVASWLFAPVISPTPSMEQLWSNNDVLPGIAFWIELGIIFACFGTVTPVDSKANALNR